MTKGFLYRTVILLAIGEWIVPATAQFRWPPELSTPTQEAQPAPAIPKGKQAPKPSNSSVAGPSVAGNWTGELTQVGSKAPYKLDLVISPMEERRNIPTLIAPESSSASGHRNPMPSLLKSSPKARPKRGGRCPDGTITLTRAGDNLALLWFGNIDAATIIAYGTLAKK
jgi:hypothetical protein